jgi:glycosyltransferase involved in cell wall biosynthesis
MPFVSVIIPNYNHAAYLQQRIESVLNQTFEDFKVIILDDCSTDNSKAIIEQYRQHPKVEYIVYNETNSGSVFKQWQKGIRLAKGDYIWIAESDDWCERNQLQVLTDGIKENSNCVLAFCQSYCVIGSNDLMWTSTHTKLSETLNGKKFIEQCMVEKNTIYNASMAVFKKSAFESVGNEYLNLRFAGDWAFWIDIAVRGNVFVSGRVLNYFRKHNKDVTTSILTSGYHYSEEIDVLNILKQKNYINTDLYEKQLLKNYFYFLLAKRKHKPADVALIESNFYNAAPKKLIGKMKRMSMRYAITLKIRRIFSK